LGGRGRWISEFEASLIYKVSSRTARATQRNPVSKNQKKKKKKKVLDPVFTFNLRQIPGVPGHPVLHSEILFQNKQQKGRAGLGRSLRG
jgi:hypothetical protein